MSYTVQRGDTLSKIARKKGVTVADLLAANPQYKADPNTIHIGDHLDIPGETAAAPCTGDRPVAPTAASTTVKKTPTQKTTGDPFRVPYGQLTFDAEGLEKRDPFFSRKAHVPGAFSGVTIGRGYDMGSRSASEIVADLTAAGIDQATAERFAEARGLTGKKAKNFVKQKKLDQLEITPEQQKALFLTIYKELEGDVIRICKKADVVHKYGHTNWETLNPLMKDVLVDLRYRGDYTGSTREVVQATCRGKRPGRICHRTDQAKLLGGPWRAT